jgi:hypothetical protein
LHDPDPASYLHLACSGYLLSDNSVYVLRLIKIQSLRMSSGLHPALVQRSGQVLALSAGLLLTGDIMTDLGGLRSRKRLCGSLTLLRCRNSVDLGTVWNACMHGSSWEPSCEEPLLRKARIVLYFTEKCLVFHYTILKFRHPVFKYKNKHSRGPFQDVLT